MQLSKNQTIFSEVFSAFTEFTENLENFEQNDQPYRLQKGELVKCSKSRVSEQLWIVKMLKGPKECLNTHGSIFLIFLVYSEKKSA